jgi:adenylate cyclase
VISIERALENDMNILDYLSSSIFQKFMWEEDLHIMVILALITTTSFIFVYQISRKMGQGVLWNFITGKYHQSRDEERIFMFMDINESTSLAENLGDIDYNNLLNDFFFDITDSILEHYGEIYRYVGDEVVVSWKLKKGLEEANFLRTFFEAKRAIYMNREKYLKQYGVIPGFTAGFNSGQVVIGEIGDVKSEISFFGNVMYETTEIEKSCKKYNAEVLLSESLLNSVDMPQIFISKKEGVVEVPSLEVITVFSIIEKSSNY